MPKIPPQTLSFESALQQLQQNKIDGKMRVQDLGRSLFASIQPITNELQSTILPKLKATFTGEPMSAATNAAKIGLIKGTIPNRQDILLKFTPENLGKKGIETVTSACVDKATQTALTNILAQTPGLKERPKTELEACAAHIMTAAKAIQGFSTTAETALKGIGLKGGIKELRQQASPDALKNAAMLHVGQELTKLIPNPEKKFHIDLGKAALSSAIEVGMMNVARAGGLAAAPPATTAVMFVGLTTLNLMSSQLSPHVASGIEKGIGNVALTVLPP